MSHEGKLRRGEAYYNTGDRNGVYPEGITNNPHKMADLNYYLEDLGKEVTDVDYSSMDKKTLKATAESLGIDISEAKTKDDLIVLLENKSDEVA